MRHFLVLLVAALSASGVLGANKPGYDVHPSAIVPRWSGAEPCEWTMDYGAALTNACNDGRFTLMMFSGMWWCPHCQALENSVLDTDAFRDYVLSNGFYLVAMDYPYRDGYSNQCWLWDEGYRRDYCGGMSAVEGTNTVNRRYQVQDAYSVPGAARQQVPIYAEDGSVVDTIDYGRVGYPTLIVIRPDGRVAGRFSVSKTFASYDYVVTRINQLLETDDWDEKDDFWQGATVLDVPPCEEEPVVSGVHTLGTVDKVDWFRVDVRDGGTLWRFKFGECDYKFGSLVVGLYADPAGEPLSETSFSETGSVFSVVVPTAGSYYLKVSPGETPESVVGYELSYDYTAFPADVSFASTAVTVKSTSKSAALKVAIANADPNAEVVVDWCAFDLTATNGVDYSAKTGTVAWAVGERKVAKQISLPILDPGVWKGDRQFAVRLYPRRHCEIPSSVSECVVTIKEARARQPGKLAFDSKFKSGSVVLRENEPFEIVVYRTDGADGAVTGLVSVVENKKNVIAGKPLVWEHGDVEPKSFVYVPADLPGIQEPQAGSVSLKVAGGARIGSVSTIRYSRYDELMTMTFADYNKSVLSSAASVKGDFWFYGSETPGGDSVLRSSILSERGSVLSLKCKGPGVLSLDIGLNGGAIADLTLEKIPLERGLGGDGHFTVAIPAGQKTITLSVSADGNTNAYATLAWKFHPFSQNILECVYPRSKSVMRISEVDRLVLSNSGDCADIEGLPVTVEFFAGESASKISLISTNTVDHTLTEGENIAAVDVVERENLAAVLGARIDKTCYWRGDIVFADEYGNRAVLKGAANTFDLVAGDAPRLDFAGVLPSGCVSDASDKTIVLPEQTVGVAAKIGPLPLTAVPDGAVVTVATKNGSLPSGLKLAVDEAGVWLSGVPGKAGSFAFDVLPSVKTTVGRKSVTAKGASVRLFVDVLALDAAASFEGYRVSVSESGSASALRGTASMTVSARGAISGKALLNGTNISFRASAFTSLSNGIFRVDGQQVKVGLDMLPMTVVLELGEREDKYYDVRLVIGDAEFWLYRNDWKSVAGKELLKDVIGYYTAALPVLEANPAEEQYGVGYLVVTIKNTGVAAYSGVDSIGKSFSGTSVIWHVPDCCNLSGYRWVFYICSKTSGSSVVNTGISGLVAVEPNESNPAIRYLSLADDGGMQLVNMTPKSIRGFSAWTNSLNVVGGTYDPTKKLTVSSSWRQMYAMSLPVDYDGVSGSSGYRLRSSPFGLQLGVNASGKPEFLADDWNTKLTSFTATTGMFGAKFSLSYDDDSARTKIRQVTVRGVWIQNSTYGHSFWNGWFGIPDKGTAIDARGRASAYPVTGSYPFVIE